MVSVHKNFLLPKVAFVLSISSQQSGFIGPLQVNLSLNNLLSAFSLITYILDPLHF